MTKRQKIIAESKARILRMKAEAQGEIVRKVYVLDGSHSLTVCAPPPALRHLESRAHG
jgi:hypothetical protein